jgi:hypothetical protein
VSLDAGAVDHVAAAEDEVDLAVFEDLPEAVCEV